MSAYHHVTSEPTSHIMIWVILYYLSQHKNIWTKTISEPTITQYLSQHNMWAYHHVTSSQYNIWAIIIWQHKPPKPLQVRSELEKGQFSSAEQFACAVLRVLANVHKCAPQHSELRTYAEMAADQFENEYEAALHDFKKVCIRTFVWALETRNCIARLCKCVNMCVYVSLRVWNSKRRCTTSENCVCAYACLRVCTKNFSIGCKSDIPCRYALLHVYMCTHACILTSMPTETGRWYDTWSFGRLEITLCMCI